MNERVCGHSSMVEPQLPKLMMRVRFPLPAPLLLHTCHLADRVDRHIGRIALPIGCHRHVEHLLGVHGLGSAARRLGISFRHFYTTRYLFIDAVS